jgi:2'-5' RNA ligase
VAGGVASFSGDVSCGITNGFGSSCGTADGGANVDGNTAGGSVDADRVPDLERVLAGIVWLRAECRYSEPLFLPAHGKRRVVALELDDPSGTLRTLQHEVSAGLAAEGLYQPEKRPWLPHVTVARFRRPGHPFSLQNVNIGAFGVVRMVLYSSDLSRGGAVHTPLADFPAS